VKARDASVWKICGGETVYSATSSGGPALWTKASVRDGSVEERAPQSICPLAGKTAKSKNRSNLPAYGWCEGDFSSTSMRLGNVKRIYCD
jgi:hypothetical protein